MTAADWCFFWFTLGAGLGCVVGFGAAARAHGMLVTAYAEEARRNFIPEIDR